MVMTGRMGRSSELAARSSAVVLVKYYHNILTKSFLSWRGPGRPSHALANRHKAQELNSKALNLVSLCVSRTGSHYRSKSSCARIRSMFTGSISPVSLPSISASLEARSSASDMKRRKSSAVSFSASGLILVCASRRSFQ